MDSCCVALRANSHLVNAMKTGHGNGDYTFLGERTRGSLNNNTWVNKLTNSLRADVKKEKKIKSGAFAVLTSNTPREAVLETETIQETMSRPPKCGLHHIGRRSRNSSFSSYQKGSYTCCFGSHSNIRRGWEELVPRNRRCCETVHMVIRGCKDRNIENVLILCGDHLYRMDYMEFLQSHINSNADITISRLPVDNSRASDYGLVKIDARGHIIQFTEKPKGADMKAMQTDNTLLGLSPQEAIRSPYNASMGVYVFKMDVLLKLLRWRLTSNDFESEIIHAAVKEHDVQAYIFKDYWEDIGTIKSFYEANLALTEEFPKFEFYDPKTPFYTSPLYLPSTKIDKCRIKDAIISHGCFLRECSVQHSIVGELSRLDYGVELQDTVMLGADYYQTEPEIASLLADGKVPVGVGHSTKIRKCIIDNNAKIGKEVIVNKDDVQEADRPEEGFYIRPGLTIITEKATIADGSHIKMDLKEYHGQIYDRDRRCFIENNRERSIRI